MVQSVYHKNKGNLSETRVQNIKFSFQSFQTLCLTNFDLRKQQTYFHSQEAVHCCTSLAPEVSIHVRPLLPHEQHKGIRRLLHVFRAVLLLLAFMPSFSPGQKQSESSFYSENIQQKKKLWRCLCSKGNLVKDELDQRGAQETTDSTNMTVIIIIIIMSTRVMPLTNQRLSHLSLYRYVTSSKLHDQTRFERLNTELSFHPPAASESLTMSMSLCPSNSLMVPSIYEILCFLFPEQLFVLSLPICSGETLAGSRWIEG